LKSVAVVGAGIFGVSCALALSRHLRVTLFERNNTILGGASYGNQNRSHYGYHYPRSIATGRECLESLPSFKGLYGSALLTDFQNYYCVARNNSKTSARQYIEFCDELSLPHKSEWPPGRFLNRDEIELSIRVPEPIFDIFALRRIASRKIKSQSQIKLRLGTAVVGGREGEDGRKVLTVESERGSANESFDYVINATYSKLNEISDWFGLGKRTFQYELVEVPVVELPTDRRTGATVMDGPFCSVLPFGGSKQTLLYHAEESVLDTSISYDYKVNQCFDSNWQRILEKSERYIPIVRNAKYIRSIIVVRVVDPASETDDARKSEIMDSESGCWSIFSGKIITAVSLASKLTTLVINHDSKSHAMEGPIRGVVRYHR